MTTHHILDINIHCPPIVIILREESPITAEEARKLIVEIAGSSDLLKAAVKANAPAPQ